MYQPTIKEIALCAGTAVFAVQFVQDAFVAYITGVSITVGLLACIVWIKNDLMR
jgi:hypothetical protein